MSSTPTSSPVTSDELLRRVADEAQRQLFNAIVGSGVSYDVAMEAWSNVRQLDAIVERVKRESAPSNFAAPIWDERNDLEPAESAPTSEVANFVERILDDANLLPLTGPKAIAAAHAAGRLEGLREGLLQADISPGALASHVGSRIRALIEKAQA